MIIDIILIVIHFKNKRCLIQIWEVMIDILWIGIFPNNKEHTIKKELMV